MEREGRIGLRTTTVAFILALTILVAIIIVIALQSYRAVDRELTDAALSRRASVASLAATTLAEKFARLTDIGIALATRVQFRQLLGSGKWIEAARILKEIPENFPFIERLFLTDPGGTLMADVPERAEVRGQNFAQRDWYQGVSENWEPYVSSVYQRAVAPRLNVFAIAIPIKSVDREVLGVLVLQVRLDTFFAWIGAVEMESDSFVYVVDRKGQLAFHPRFSPQGKLVDFSAVPAVRTALEGKKGVEITFNPIENEERVSAYAPIGKYGWGVVAAQPVASAFAAKHYQSTRLLIAYGLILLLCVFMVYLVSHMVLQRRQAAQDRQGKAELERRVAERTAQLSDSEERNRAIVDTAVDAIIVIDERGTIQRFNTGAERMFGYPEAEVAGKNVALLMPSPYREQHDGYLARFLATGEKRIIGIGRDVVARRKDGTEFPIHLAVTEMRLGESRLFTGIIRDITEAKRAAERQAHLVANLEAANKELEGFSYSVSHDLRSPLRAIDGYSQMLEEDYAGKLDDEGRRLLGVVRDSSQKMGNLIDDLLAFSKLGRQPITAAEINMNALVQEVLEELRAASGEITQHCVIEPLPAAWCDRALLRQVWVNLLSNAFKFAGKRERPVIKVAGHNSGTENVYSVRDNGAGFDMQYYDKLFGVFQRLHSADEFRGTGVGLAIVRRVVTRHGGRVWAEGKLNHGATFFFALPKG